MTVHSFTYTLPTIVSLSSFPYTVEVALGSVGLRSRVDIPRHTKHNILIFFRPHGGIYLLCSAVPCPLA